MRHDLPRNLLALSLVETIIAVFLLSAQILWLSVATQSYTRNQRDLAKREQACWLASQKIEEIRQWAKRSANFSSDWQSHDGSVQPSPDGVFETRVRCSLGLPLLSPCSSLEGPWATRAKRLTKSMVAVHVSVSWRPNDPLAVYETSVLIAEPPHPAPYTVRLNPTSGTIAPANSALFDAAVLDRDGLEVPDLQWDWRIIPITGNGTVRASTDRSQREVRLHHLFWRYGVQVSIPGTVRLEARTRYQGQEINARTGDILLQ